MTDGSLEWNSNWDWFAAASQHRKQDHQRFVSGKMAGLLRPN